MKVSKFRIRQARERKGWRQEQLATAAGLSRPYITQIEQGIRDPSGIALKAIAEALEVDINDLLESEVTCPHCGEDFLL